MSKFRLIVFIILVSILAADSYAQAVKPFTSAEGGFSIDLAPPDTTETVGPVAETHSGGKHYSWESAKGVYDAGYVDLLPAVGPKLYADLTANGMIDEAKKSGSTLKYKKDITLGDMTGVEFAITLKGDGQEAVFFNRIYAKNGRAYMLDAIWPASQDGAAQTKVLDSFKLTTPVKTETTLLTPAGPFVSAAGGFSIDLPAKPDEESTGDVGGTPLKSFLWRFKDGTLFAVGYMDTGAVTKEDQAKLLTASADNITASLAAQGSKVLSRKDITAGGYPGIELRVRLKEGPIGLNRYYAVNSRLFVFTTGWDAGTDGAAQLKILDSFKLTSPAKPAAAVGPFVSEKGWFSVDVPAKPDEEKVTDAAPGGKGPTGSYTWAPNDSQVFSVDYMETGIPTKEERASMLVKLVDRTVKGLTDEGSKLESKKDIVSGNYPGIEVRLRLKEGPVTILRYYMVDSRLFILTTGWDAGTDGAAELKIMDSFKILAPPAIPNK